MEKNIKIVDSTLNEIHLKYGFTVTQYNEILSLLTLLPIDMIEINCDYNFNKRLIRESLRNKCSIIAIVNMNSLNIDEAISLGVPWIGFSFKMKDLKVEKSNSNTQSYSINEFMNQIISNIKYVRKKNVYVMMRVECTSYEELPLIMDIFCIAVNAGANRICFSDYKGILEPLDLQYFIRKLKTNIPDIDVEIRLHNNRGLAIANSLIAITEGANWICTSISGIGGEGITDLSLLLYNLYYKNKEKAIPNNILNLIYEKISAYLRISIIPKEFNFLVNQNSSLVYNCSNSEENIEREKNEKYILPEYTEKLFLTPKIISSTELDFHNEGPGIRYVMIDERFLQDCRQYCIVREIRETDKKLIPHVEPHCHKVDSLYLFLGTNSGLTGLTVEVQINSVSKVISSPSAVFIPASMSHSYRVIGGEGLFVNHVLAGNYNNSLLNVISKDRSL